MGKTPIVTVDERHGHKQWRSPGVDNYYMTQIYCFFVALENIITL